MAVYVDDMRAPLGRMTMCHMIADTDDELHAMADSIGVARQWWQAPPRYSSHYDISLGKRAIAIAQGAIPISMRTCGIMTMRRRKTGSLGAPDDAASWLASQNSG